MEVPNVDSLPMLAMVAGNVRAVCTSEAPELPNEAGLEICEPHGQVAGR